MDDVSIICMNDHCKYMIFFFPLTTSSYKSALDENNLQFVIRYVPKDRHNQRKIYANKLQKTILVC